MSTDEDYLFHDGEWWVRSTTARALVEGERERVAGVIESLALALVSEDDGTGAALTAAVLQRAASIVREVPDA